MNEKKFRELKIDEDLRDLLPPQTEEEHKILEESIKNNGCTSPIYVWNDYIVDGHNRYGICKKYNYGFDIVVLDSNYKKDDIKMWMLDTQLGRRNLTDVKRIIIAEQYRELIERKAKENQGKRSDLNIPLNSSECLKPIETRKELAKIAGVGIEKYERTKKILKTDNGEVKDKLINGEISVNKAYITLFPKKDDKQKDETENSNIQQNIIEKELEVKKELNKKIKNCSKCGQDKCVDEFYIEHDICKECELGEPERKENNKITNDEFNKLLERKYTIADNSNLSVNGDLQSIEEDCGDFIMNLEDRLFETEKTYEKMQKEDKEKFKSIIDNFINDINNILNKIK